MSDLRYKRILLKFSGEALAGDQGFGIDPEKAALLAESVKEVHDLGVEVGIVIGAGNLWRGAIGIEYGMEQARADHMGMIATCMNALALADGLERGGMVTRVQTAIEMLKVAEPYIRGRAIRHLEKGRVVVFGGGTGSPFFTTDTAGSLRAIEINADVLIKATKVDAVYTADPNKDPNAKRFQQVSYQDALNQQLRVMDLTAISLCMDNKMPIAVLNMWEPGSVKRFVQGEVVGTLISSDDTIMVE